VEFLAEFYASRRSNTLSEFRLPVLADETYSWPRVTSRHFGEIPSEVPVVSRDYEPVPGKWYADLEGEDSFQVLSVEPDEEIVRIQWPDREIQEIDLDSWQEMDLELAEAPDGWVDDVEPADDEDDDDEVLAEAAEDWDEDEDWDDDEEDDDYDDDDDEYRDRE